jgi:hypothetical protein
MKLAVPAIRVDGLNGGHIEYARCNERPGQFFSGPIQFELSGARQTWKQGNDENYEGKEE